MHDADFERLELSLSQAFGDRVRVEILSESSQPSARLVVCNMSYRPGDMDSNSRTVRQTAVVLNADDLDLPQFALSPRRNALLSKFASALLGGMTLTFEDSPEFSEAFYLQGWVEDAVRTLFDKDLRDFFLQERSWSVRGHKNQLVIFRHNIVYDDQDVDSFAHEALHILSLFRDAETRLDERPEIRRAATPDDMRARAQSMGGLAGALLQGQLNKIAVSQVELDAFLNEPPPRNPPPGLKRQVLGDNFMLIPIGLLFFVVGIVLGGTFVGVGGGKTERSVGLLFLILFPLIGGLMAGLTMKFRSRKLRLLRNGTVVSGTPIKARQSNIRVNEQLRHVITLQYEIDGRTHTTTSNAYGEAAAKAHQMADAATAVTLLVDPADPSHVLCTDFLTIFTG